jgi:hypothetical protein
MAIDRAKITTMQISGAKSMPDCARRSTVPRIAEGEEEDAARR